MALLTAAHVLRRTSARAVHAADALHPSALSDSSYTLFPSHPSQRASGAASWEALRLEDMDRFASADWTAGGLGLDDDEDGEAEGAAGSSAVSRLSDGLELPPALDLCRLLAGRFGPLPQVRALVQLLSVASVLLAHGAEAEGETEGEGGAAARALEEVLGGGSGAIAVRVGEAGGALPPAAFRRRSSRSDSVASEGAAEGEADVSSFLPELLPGLLGAADDDLVGAADASRAHRTLAAAEAAATPTLADSRAVGVSLLRLVVTQLASRALIRAALAVRQAGALAAALQRA